MTRSLCRTLASSPAVTTLHTIILSLSNHSISSPSHQYFAERNPQAKPSSACGRVMCSYLAEGELVCERKDYRDAQLMSSLYTAQKSHFPLDVFSDMIHHLLLILKEVQTDDLAIPTHYTTRLPVRRLSINYRSVGRTLTSWLNSILLACVHPSSPATLCFWPPSTFGQPLTVNGHDLSFSIFYSSASGM